MQSKNDRSSRHLGGNTYKDIEPATVGHSNDDGLDAEASRLVDDVLHARDHHLHALESEPLLGAVLLGQEVLEPGRSRDTGEQEPLVVGLHGEGVRRLQSLSEPVDLNQIFKDPILKSD